MLLAQREKSENDIWVLDSMSILHVQNLLNYGIYKNVVLGEKLHVCERL